MPLSREKILEKLKGQVIKIPDLKPLLAGWPGGASSDRFKLTILVDRRLESLINDPKKLAKLKRADFALFASTWWPYAGFYELETVAYLVIWLFLWDDEIDESTGSLNNDFEGSQAYRRDTIQFVKQSLGLEPQTDLVSPRYLVIHSFRTIGDRLRKTYSMRQRRLFIKEITHFMKMSEREQKVRLSQHVPSIEEYWQIRMGTSAVGVCAAVIEHALKLQLPSLVIRDRNMQKMWNECNIIVSITNDMISLRKELALDCIDSLIPLYTATGVPVQNALEDACQELGASIKRFDAAALQLMSTWCSRGPDTSRHKLQRQMCDELPTRRVSKLRKKHSINSTTTAMITSTVSRPTRQAAPIPLANNIAKFVDALRQICVGNLTWSLMTDRYGLSKLPKDTDGNIEVVL